MKYTSKINSLIEDKISKIVLKLVIFKILLNKLLMIIYLLEVAGIMILQTLPSRGPGAAPPPQI